MAITKEKKKEILEKLENIVRDSQSLVFVNFHGLSVSDSTKIRQGLRGNKVSYYVAKKTLVNKVLEESDISGNKPDFKGELGIVYGEDYLSPSREIYSYQKELDNRVSILGGVFEGKFMNKDEMLSIAQIPSVQTLHAQFVNLVNSPIQGFVMALSEVAKQKEEKAA